MLEEPKAKKKEKTLNKIDENQMLYSDYDSGFTIKTIKKTTFSSPKNPKYIFIEGLNHIFNKFFFEKKLLKHNFFIREYEKKIFKNLLKQKRLITNLNKKLDFETLNHLQSKIATRKTEDQLKFVLKKCIRQLQDEFLQNIRNEKIKDHLKGGVSMKEYKNNIDFHFYSFYFGEISKEKNLPIETFFHFRSIKNKSDSKTINFRIRQSISFWKLNPVFISKIINFIDSGFIKNFEIFNQNKIRLLLIKWDDILDEFGVEKGTRTIIRSLKSRGFKLPWTLGDVREALLVTSKILQEN